MLHDDHQTYRRPFRALPSRHRGVSFRSLTEVRWAAWLDALGVPWIYEPQGFPVGDDKPYLTDFWLPTWDCYMETKSLGVPLDVAITKCRVLARETGKRVLLAAGQPGGETYHVNAYARGGDESMEVEQGHFVECPRCDGFGILGELGMVEIGPHPCQSTVTAPLHTPVSAPRLFAAYAAAQNVSPGAPR